MPDLQMCSALPFCRGSCKCYAGYYTSLGGGALDAFMVDVTTALDNFRAASQRSGLEFAAMLADKRAADVADIALATLLSLTDKHKELHADSTKSKPAHKVINRPVES